MAKDSVVFVSTIHRMSERVISAINELQKDFDVKILNTGQSSFETDYEANTNYKNYVLKNFKSKSIFNTPRILNSSHARQQKNCKRIYDNACNLIDKNTVALILDDSRHRHYDEALYAHAKSNNSKVFANCHGNTPVGRMTMMYGQKDPKFYDNLFVLGNFDKEVLTSLGHNKETFLSGGIPANDDLIDAKKTNEYILVIANMVLKSQAGSTTWDYTDKPLPMDRKTLSHMNLLELQNKLEKKVVFKLKHRMSSPMEKELNFLKSSIPEGLDYDIIYNTGNEKELISSAACILTYGSTMSFKPIQLEIPTVIYKDLGDLGNFSEYKGSISIEESYDFILEENFMKNERKSFLSRTLAGGIDFSSTKHYLDSFYNNL